MGKSKTRLRRYGRSVPTGEVSQDPAKGLASAPPNLGRPLIPQIITFSGRNTAWTNIYKSPDEALNHSRSNARHMRNDPSIMECLEARQRGTALLNWHVDPEDKKDPRQKQLVEDVTGILEAIPQFTEYRRNLLEALWYGRYANQHKWGYQFVRGARRMTLCGWRPIHGDKLLFRYDDGSGKYDDNDIGIRVGQTFGVGDVIAGDRVLEMTDWGMGYFLEAWERPLLCVHKHIIEDGAFEDPLSAGRIHGVGIRDRIYWCWFQKQETMAHLMEVIERTGTGFTIYYYPYGNPEGEQKMRDVAEQQTKNNVLLIPRMSGDPAMDAYGIDRIEPSSVGIDALKSIIHEFFGHQIKRYILGQILSTESAATGLGSGVADLHQDTFYGIIAYDAVKLEETLTEQLVRPIVEYNFPWARNIRLRFKIDTEANESDRKLQAAKQAWDMGARLKASDIMDLIGFSVPTEDDEVLQNPSLMQQQRLWEQTHQQPPGEGGAMGDGGGGDFPPGSPEDSFGPLMGLLGQGPQQQPQQYAKQRYSKLSEAVDAAAKESERNPSDAQKEAGNYRKGKVTLHGMPVTIENAKGSRRRPEWPPLATHYGYINRTEGRDGDHVDVFIGPNPESEIVFVVDQVTEGGRFDEHKCMLGYCSEKEAKDAYLANYTPGWKVGPMTALTIQQFKAWLESGDTTKPVAKQVSRYEKNGMPASPAEVAQHRVGETKSINGKTYRLNQNHRWELAQGNDNETTDVDVSGLAQPEDDHKQRLGFVKKQLSKVHPHAAGIMRALQASPDFAKGAEYATQDVHPKQAAALYQFLQQNAGNDVGGSLVHDFGEGRLGYATPAGSIIVWPEANGTHQIAYTAKTGIVDRAMTGKETQPSTVEGSQPGLAETTDIPQDSGEMPGAAPAPGPQTPPAAPAAQVPSDSLDEDDRAFVAQGQQEKAQRLANLPEKPTLSPAAQATLERAGGNFGNTPRGLADKARSAYEDAVQEWENAVSSGADRKTVASLRAKAHGLRSVWRERESQAKAEERTKPQRSPKVQAAIKQAAETLGIGKDDSNPLLDAAESGQGGGAVPEASPEALAKRKQADAEQLKHRKLRDWENNVGLHLQEAGIDDTPEHREALQKEIDSGRISERGHLESVLRDAKRAHERGDMSAPVTPHLQQAISRRINRAEQERKTFDHAVRQKAQEWGIDESSLRQAVDDAWGEKLKHHEERESAKSYARKITGLTAADINRLENQGQDIDAVKGIDTAADQIASMFPGLGWEGLRNESSSELSQRLWELIREGNVEAPSKTSDEFWDEVGAFLDRGAGGGEEYSDEEIAQMREENEAIPFHRLGFVIRYRKWVQRYAGRRTPRVSPGQKSLFPNTAGTGHNAKWEESKHPRDHGKFAPKGQGKVASSPGQMLLNLSAEEVQQHKDEIAELRKELLGGEVTPKEAAAELQEIVKPQLSLNESSRDRKREREYSDQEIAEREQARIFEEVMRDPTKSSQRDLTIARGYLDASVRHEHRKLQRGDSTADQHKNMVEGLQRESDHIDSLLKDYANGRKVPPVDDMNRAEKIADEAIASDRNIGEVAKEMGLSRQEFHEIRAEVAKHMEERKALESEPSPARKRAMERQKQIQAEAAPKPQTDLLGQPLKPEAKKPDFGSTSGKQEALFDKSGKPGQKNLFADKGVPDELVQKPRGKEYRPGDRLVIPANHTTGEFEAELQEAGNGKLGIKRAGTNVGPLGSITAIEKERLPQFLDDLHGRVSGSPTSSHDSVNAVLSGKAKFLGRGNDGLAFDTGDGNVVKVASDTPFHWNNGLKPHGEGSATMRKAVEVNEKLRGQGVPGLLPQQLIEHDGRTYTVMPKVATDSSLSQEHIDQLAHSVRGMHEQGYSIGDDIQVGIGADGKAYIYDTGALKPLGKGEKERQWDKEDDEGRMSRLAQKHGASFSSFNPHKRYDDLLEKALTAVESWKDKPAGMPPAVAKMHKAKLEEAWGALDDELKDFYSDGHVDTLAELDKRIGEPAPAADSKPEGEAEKPEASSTTKKEPWQMTSHDFEQSQMGPTYGDWYFTPEGKYVQMRGSGGMGSGRVGALDIHGNFVGYYDRSELRLANKSSRPSSSEDAADKWLADVTSRVAELRNKHQGLLLGKGITEQFRDSLAKGKMTQAQFDKALADGTVLSDKDMKQAEEVERQINEIRSTPLTVPVNEDHKRAVQQALAAGHPVPAEVLAEYPDLQEKPAASEPEAEPAKPTEPPATEPETPVESPAMPAAAPAKKPAKPAKEPAKEQPAAPDSFDPAQHIKIAADSIEKLRKQDVYRVLDQVDPKNRAAVADYVRKNRPELADEVSESLADLGEPAPAADSKPEGEGVTEEQAKSRKWTKNEDGTYTSPNGTIWKKAAAGGEVSPVTGEHFKGGSLMPIHGLAQKQPKPEGKGTASGDSKPKEEGKKETRPVRQMSPEQIEAERQRREEQKQWDKIRTGPLGDIMEFSEKAYAYPPTTNSKKKFQPAMKALGAEKTKQLTDMLQQWWEEDTQKELGDDPNPKFGGEPMPREHWMHNAREQLQGHIDDHGNLLYPKNLRAANPHAHGAEMLLRSVKLTPDRLQQLSDAVGKLKRGESLTEKPADSSPTVPETPTSVKPSTIDSPAQGSLEQARKAKADAWKQVKALREQLKNEPMKGNGGNIRLKLIKAETAHREAMLAEKKAAQAIEGRANELGQTTDRHNIKIGGRSITATYAPDGATRVETSNGVKVVTYKQNGVKYGYTEDLAGGNVRPFVIRQQGGKIADTTPTANEEEAIRIEAERRRMAEVDNQKKERRAEFESNTGHTVLSASKVASDIAKAGLPVFKNTARDKQSGASVRSLPGKKTWLAVEWKNVGHDDHDFEVKSQELQQHLEGQGYTVTRPFPDKTILAVRKSLASVASPPRVQSAIAEAAKKLGIEQA